MHKIKHTIAACLLFSSATAQPFTLIKAGKLFDAVSGKITVSQQLLLNGNVIVAVGEKLDTPKGTIVIDLGRYTVLPGLIESHQHLFYNEPLHTDFTAENVKMITTEGDALRSLRAAARSKTFLDAGITTVKDLGNSGQYLDVALKKAIREGSIEGPRIIASGPILSSPGGQMPGLLKKYEWMADEEYRIIKNPDDARLAVKEHINYGADLIKICADNSPNNTSLSIDEMKAIVETAHRYHKKVTAHATSSKAIFEAIEAGVDGIEHGYGLSDSAAVLMAQKGMFLCPTNLTVALFSRYTGVSKDDAAKRLVSAHRLLMMAQRTGVKIVAGSDNYAELGTPRSDALKNVLLAYYEAGMKPLDILLSATRTAGEFLDLPRTVGMLKKDAVADLIAVDGDLENDFSHAIFQVRFIMKNGKVYKQLP